MSGISVTILLKNNISNEQDVIEKLKSFGSIRALSDTNFEILINTEIIVEDQQYYVDDKFLIEVFKKPTNPGFPENTWMNIFKSSNGFNSNIDISCMSRNIGTVNIILRFIKKIASFDEILIVNDKIDFFSNYEKNQLKVINEDSIILIDYSMIDIMINNSIYSIGTN